jgi:hypothetical protein
LGVEMVRGKEFGEVIFTAYLKAEVEVEYYAVFMEAHMDGKPHFHVSVK